MKLRAKERFECYTASVIRPYASAYRHAINNTTDLGFQVTIDEYPNLTGTAKNDGANIQPPLFTPKQNLGFFHER